MGELLAGLLEGLLEGLFGSVLGDLSASVIGRLVRFSLCGEEGSRFLIQRADAMRGPEGLRRETVRRRRMRWEFGLLLFFMAVEVFFWILTLFVRNESDFTLRIRKYGFPVFAGTAGILLLYLWISRGIIFRRIRKAPPFAPGPFETEFAVYRYRNASAITTKLSFGFVTGFFAILVAVLWYVSSPASPVLFPVVVVLFFTAAGLITLALLDRADVVPAVILTEEGIFPVPGDPAGKQIGWGNVRDFSLRDGDLEIHIAESKEKPEESLCVSLGSTLYSAEIIRFKIDQYRRAGKKPDNPGNSRLDLK